MRTSAALKRAETSEASRPQTKRPRPPAHSLPALIEALAPLGADVEAMAATRMPARPAHSATASRKWSAAYQAIATGAMVAALHIAIIRIFLAIGAS